MNCLAQDFDFLKQQIKIFGKVYDCKLELNPTKKKNGKRRSFDRTFWNRSSSLKRTFKKNIKNLSCGKKI